MIKTGVLPSYKLLQKNSSPSAVIFIDYLPQECLYIKKPMTEEIFEIDTSVI